MVKHTREIADELPTRNRREIADELFECVWPFCIADEFLSVFDHFVELAIKGLIQLVINITLLSKKLPYFKIKIKKNRWPLVTEIVSLKLEANEQQIELLNIISWKTFPKGSNQLMSSIPAITIL